MRQALVHPTPNCADIPVPWEFDMPRNAYIQKMVDQTKSGNLAGSPIFQSLVPATARQFRAPFMARHGAVAAVQMLEALWPRVRNRQPDQIHVHGTLAGEHATITTVMADQPFIVDTFRLTLQQLGATYAGGFNVVVGMSRDADGTLSRVDGPGDQLESMVLNEADGLDEAGLAELMVRLEGNLRLGQAAVRDFQSMTDLLDGASYQLGRVADRTPDRGDELRETAELLRWLLADNFVFMGLICGDQRFGSASAGLEDVFDVSSLLNWAANERIVDARKGAQESRIHRAGRLDELRIRVPNGAGSGMKDVFVQGLFTHRAITQPSRHVPILRQTLATILRSQESQPGSYRYKGIANVFDSLPTEFLFTADTHEVVDLIDRVLEAEQEHETRAHLVQHAETETTFVLAALPRERWSEALRSQMEAAVVSATGASYCDHGVFVGRYQTMLVHYFLTGTRVLTETETSEMLQGLVTMGTPWQNRLLAVLNAQNSEERASELFRRYGNAFESLYMQTSSPERAAADIALLEKLPRDVGVEVALFQDQKGRVKLRMLQAQDIILSTILPVLDDFGLVVIDQYADSVSPTGRPNRTIDTFRLQGVSSLETEELLERGPLLVDALRAVFANSMPVDPMNRILLRAAVPWQGVDMLRAYNGYARQLGLRYTVTRVQEILLGRPSLVKKLWDYFQAKFDPDLEGDRAAVMKSAHESCEGEIVRITDHDQDRVFNTLFNLMQATLRTNFYRTDRTEHYISFKVDASAVKMMPEPRLQYEVYVHHREMEGIHLRGGSIARGGIRWSDREDYRREIFDLASTQMVKNVLIVPEGAKGGFYIKHNTGSRAERRATADRLYRILVRGMLDVTDNIVAGGIEHPPQVVRHDGDDPYIVVAADKGTAHLSDTANGISQSYGFWLDDAFASGGSNGYDHKEVGITARGGWMTVRRLFSEMGLDPRSETFTCVGIGDPSGDVFGNGVVEHDKMRLIAAFNHLHIFIDPDPDPDVSYEERKRLFDASFGWDQYDTSKLSPGGGIFSRRAKAIQLTPEIKERLGVLQDELPVEVVLRLILRLDVDLMWNGGIGTYVKASNESHADAGDPTNDSVRVNANELRCKAVGEGGNLGFTPASRIEFALLGGRINTDFIDNSGGVDMSDHEVNLKILLNPMVSEGVMSLPERNTLLESLTDEVADDVLANSDRHARQLSLDIVRSQMDPLTFSGAIDWVCRRGGLSRSTLHLPSDDVLQRRQAAGQGVTRPELAVLQAHVKMHVFKELNQSDTKVIPGFTDKVLGYFPDIVAERFTERIGKHMLFRDIGMTVVVGEVVGDAGALYFPMVSELTGQPMVRIARAWYKALDLVGADSIRTDLNASGAPLEVLYRAWIPVTQAAMGLVMLWLAPGEPGEDAEDSDRIRTVLSRIGKLRGTALEGRIEARVDEFSNTKVPVAVRKRIALLGELAAAREIARSCESDEAIRDGIVRYLALGEASRLLPAIRALESRKAQGGWDPVAIGILRNRYILLLRELEDAVDVRREVRLGVDRVATRLGRGELKSLRVLMAHLLGDQPDVSALLVAEERVRAWIAEFRKRSQ
jgi:glutamate dehydrogenase